MGGKDQKLVAALQPPNEPTIINPEMLAPGDRIVWDGHRRSRGTKILRFVGRTRDVTHYGAPGVMNQIGYAFVDDMGEHPPSEMAHYSRVRPTSPDDEFEWKDPEFLGVTTMDAGVWVLTASQVRAAGWLEPVPRDVVT